MHMLDRLTKGAAPLSLLIMNKAELTGDSGSPASVTVRELVLREVRKVNSRTRTGAS